MNMKPTILAVTIALAFTAHIYADATLKQTGTGKVMGFNGTMPTTTYLKGGKMRVDTVSGDKTTTSIFDVDNQKMYMFDSKKKEADVFDMAAFAEEMSKSVAVGEVKSSIKPNGKTKQIDGKTANGYDIEVSVPATMGGKDGMEMTVNLTGQTWIVKGAPGTADYAAFYKAAAQKGFIFSDPRAAKASPGQAKAMAKMYEQFASIGGVPYETVMDIKLAGNNPMAGLMAKMGSMNMSTTTQSIETGPIAADMFAPPAGYKLNLKK